MRRKIRNLYNILITCFFSGSCNSIKNDWINKIDNMKICDTKYTVNHVNFGNSSAKHKWVGAQFHNGRIYAIPNDETRVLIHNSETYFLDGIKDGLFKWTGGCVWNDAVYCFPRSSNSFLKIKDDNIVEIPLSINYNHEHHYSGVCTDHGIVYQPPRNTNHILKTDLNTGVSTKIVIVKDVFRVNFRYCGSIKHPNGYIYFFPENGRVIKLDSCTDKWTFIGKRISTMCFDAKVGSDGNIYGYSAYRNGIMKIDVYNDDVKMIHEEIKPGAYGTKYGLDGCMYSIPGDGSKIWKYDLISDKVEEIHDLHDDTKAKYAGGITLSDGRIICVPATANDILILKPIVNKEISEDIYKEYFVDNY